MTIVLSHISALHYWRSARVELCSHEDASNAKAIISKVPKLDWDTENVLSKIEKPFHVLISKSSLRRTSSKLYCHEWKSSLPKGFIINTGRGFCVSSPELCFFQMARVLDCNELIALGFELCGSYTILEDSSATVKPLTTVARLNSYIQKLKGVPGIQKAKRALRYIIEGSASPMETALTMILCLPYKLGGYGLPKPQLNYRIDLRTVSRKSGLVNFYVCDLYWPHALLAAEYDSDMFHTGADRIMQDSIRRSDLAFEGITVISVTKRQLKNSFELSKLAKLFAKKLGKRLQYTEPGFSRSSSELRKSLFSSFK